MYGSFVENMAKKGSKKKFRSYKEQERKEDGGEKSKSTRNRQQMRETKRTMWETND